MKKNRQIGLFDSSQEGRAALARKSGFLDAIKLPAHQRGLIVISYGGGVDSTAMILALLDMGVIPNLIIFADTSAEKPETYSYIRYFSDWLMEHYGIRITICRYQPTTAPYDDLPGELEHNGTLPGAALGPASCSIKWKQDAILHWMKGVPARGRRPASAGWKPALDAWAAGEKIWKLIGLDAGSKDRKRSHHIGDDRHNNVYLLRELGMDRLDSANLILSHGLRLPIKSACWHCNANKPEELRYIHHHHPELFRRALRIETNALPKLKSSEGFWRHTRISDGRPGNWKQWALKEGLIELDDRAPDGFVLLPQENPPLVYPDEEIAHLLGKQGLSQIAA